MLDNVVDLYSSFVVFQPIINGIGGNLVSVQSSRISTMLHQSSLPGIIPPHTKLCATPWAALFKGRKYCVDLYHTVRQNTDTVTSMLCGGLCVLCW